MRVSHGVKTYTYEEWREYINSRFMTDLNIEIQDKVNKKLYESKHKSNRSD